MDKNQFDAFLPIKIQNIIKIMMQEKSFDFFEAIELFYKSETYQSLVDEQTKFWHFSDYKIIELWQLEKNDLPLTILDV